LRSIFTLLAYMLFSFPDRTSLLTPPLPPSVLRLPGFQEAMLLSLHGAPSTVVVVPNVRRAAAAIFAHSGSDTVALTAAIEAARTAAPDMESSLVEAAAKDAGACVLPNPDGSVRRGSRYRRDNSVCSGFRHERDRGP
jgi:hypothetical protein